MNIAQLVDNLLLIAEDAKTGKDTPIAVTYVDKNGDAPENPIFKTATNCALKRVKLLGSDQDVYAIVLS